MKNKKIMIQFIKFGIVGGLNTLLTYLIYYVGISLGLHYIISNAVAFVITVFISFLLNSNFVFRGEKRSGLEWLKALLKVYASYAGTSLVLSSVLLWVWVDCIGISEKIAPFINLVFTVPINFLLNKYWAYRDKS